MCGTPTFEIKCVGIVEFCFCLTDIEASAAGATVQADWLLFRRLRRLRDGASTPEGGSRFGEGPNPAGWIAPVRGLAHGALQGQVRRGKKAGGGERGTAGVHHTVHSGRLHKGKILK